MQLLKENVGMIKNEESWYHPKKKIRIYHEEHKEREDVEPAEGKSPSKHSPLLRAA